MISCLGKSEKKEIKINERIKSFNIETYLSADDMHKIKESEYKRIWSNKFDKISDTILYKKDEIYISYLTLTNGCANYVGDINLIHDSLYIKLINTRDYVCTEQGIDRVRFRINNPYNNKYTIVKW
jgi:hypothetical protein